MNKFELTVEQYMSVVRFELAKRLSDRCGVRITNNGMGYNDGLHSIRISWDDWNFEVGLKAFKTYYGNKVPVDACVKEIIADVKSEFAKQLLK